MKKLTISALLACFIALASGTAMAQKFAPIDKSPLSITYYPITASMESKAPLIKVLYSRPYKKGREIFGKMEKYGEVWRAGANQETEVRFYKNVTIAGTEVPAGTYSMFIIPEKDSWTFIFNKQTDHWGAYSYDKSMDVVRAKVATKTPSTNLENFSITFMDDTSGPTLVAGWDNVMASLPIKM